MGTATPDNTLILLTAIPGTTPLLTEPVQLLQVTVLVAILPYMEMTEDIHLGPTVRARPSFPLTLFLNKGEPVGAMSKIEETQEEHTDKQYGRDR